VTRVRSKGKGQKPRAKGKGSGPGVGQGVGRYPARRFDVTTIFPRIRASWRPSSRSARHCFCAPRRLVAQARSQHGFVCTAQRDLVVPDELVRRGAAQRLLAIGADRAGGACQLLDDLLRLRFYRNCVNKREHVPEEPEGPLVDAVLVVSFHADDDEQAACRRSQREECSVFRMSGMRSGQNALRA